MYALDFEYDGKRLSDYGCIICDFDFSGGAAVATAGSTVTFNRASRNYGKIWSLTGISYDSCIETTFDICKDPDLYDLDLNSEDPRVFTYNEFRSLAKWLNRTDGFHRFNVFSLEKDSEIVYFNASFNIEKIKVQEKIVGLRLSMFTDRPFGVGAERTFSQTISADAITLNKQYKIDYRSDVIGDIYPKVVITIRRSGNFVLTNVTNESTLTIKDCSIGEVITVDPDTLMISSSTDRNLWDNFNFKYFKLSNTIDNGDNYFTVSLPCTIEITYQPIIKDAPN